MSRAQESRQNMPNVEEIDRRKKDAIDNIRVEATYTPLLHNSVRDKIKKNPFKRLMCDNRLYTHLVNSLKDDNIPATERHPPLDSFLALEAMLPIQYKGRWNSVLNGLFTRCNTMQWIENRLREENHHAFAQSLKKAEGFLDKHLSDSDQVQSREKEKLLGRIDDSFWREDPKDHALVAPIMARVEKQEKLTRIEVLTVLAIHDGEMPPLLLKHLVCNQDSDYVCLGDVCKAVEQFETEPDMIRHVDGAKAITAEVEKMETLAITLDEIKDAKQAACLRKHANDLRSISGPAHKFLRTIREGRIRKSVESPSRRSADRSASPAGTVFATPVATPRASFAAAAVAAVETEPAVKTSSSDRSSASTSPGSSARAG